ncbi:hypothetical protein TNCV_1717941, partial [Trichonephila clavipes]
REGVEGWCLESRDGHKGPTRESFNVRLLSLIADLQKRALPGKLFYQNGSNHLAALFENRRLKHLQKGPVSRIDLKKIIVKFEDTGDLDVRCPKEDGNRLGLESRRSFTSVEENAPGSPTLQQVVDQCHAS